MAADAFWYFSVICPEARKTNPGLADGVGDRVPLITKNGYDWAARYPWIVEAVLKNRQKWVSIRTAVRRTVAASAALATNRPSAAFEINFIVGLP